MEGILIKGITMPDENGFIDVRIYGDGEVVIPCGGEFTEARATRAEIPDNE